MNLLALETSGEYCSVALWTAEGSVAFRHEETPARHTEFLLPACAALCAEAGITHSALDGLAFGAGPGAFTGVRVAASAVQGLALALDLPGSACPVWPRWHVVAGAQPECAIKFPCWTHVAARFTGPRTHSHLRATRRRQY